MLSEFESFIHQESEILQSYPIYFWILGPYASGKTTLRKELELALSPTYQVGTITDGKFVLEAIKEDESEQYHRKTDEGGFIITSSKINVQVLQKLYSALQSFSGQVCIIEKALSVDPDGIRDSTMRTLLASMSEDIQSRSVFTYLQCSYDERLARNEGRSGSHVTGDHRRVNPAVFTKYGQRDDFDEMMPFITRPVIIINTERNEVVGVRNTDR